MFGVVLDEVRNNRIGNFYEFDVGLIVLHSQFVLFSDVVGEIAHVFMTPDCEVASRAFEQI